MRLSELNTGEKGVIVKVLGHGGFRKRIVEMGFIRGKMVTVLLNAPLQDPVKYKIMFLFMRGLFWRTMCFVARLVFLRMT